MSREFGGVGIEQIPKGLRLLEESGFLCSQVSFCILIPSFTRTSSSRGGGFAVPGLARALLSVGVR
jgi:hypothetical protein